MEVTIGRKYEIVHISVYAGLTMEMFRKYKGMNKFKSYMRGRISKILQKNYK